MRLRTLGIAASILLLGAEVSAQPVASVRAVYQPDGVTTRPDAPEWGRAPKADLLLIAQLINVPHGGGSVSAVSVQAMHDGESLAIRLEWADEAADRAVGVDTFRDAAAVGFPLGDSEVPPSPFMGDLEHPVAIWQWTADLDADARGHGGFAERYPHTDGVWYFPQDAAVRREVRAWRGAEPVVEFVATGFGTLTRGSSHNARGVSEHADGRWSVVLRHPLRSGDPNDAFFAAGETTRLIVAIWNGSGAEVNGMKNVTVNWTPFALDSTLAADERP
jgi:hypothetical protein